MTLLQKQMLFTKLVHGFLGDLKILGYDSTFGEAYRSPETCELMAKEGKGITNSLHRLRLALDLCLFRDGVYLTKSVDYLPAGQLWESYSMPDLVCSWGGRFLDRPDGNHFSVEHEGFR